MRRRDKEINNKEELEEILIQTTDCRVSFAVNNQPYLVPVNHVYHEGALYFHSAPTGKKIDFITQNYVVCFEATSVAKIVAGGKACDWTTQYRSVIGYGKASILTSLDDKIMGLDLLMKKFADMNQPDYDENLLKRMVIIKVDIESITGKHSGF